MALFQPFIRLDAFLLKYKYRFLSFRCEKSSTNKARFPEKKSGLQNKSRRTAALAVAHHLQKLLVKRKRYFGLSKYLNEAFVGLQVEKLE